MISIKIDNLYREIIAHNFKSNHQNEFIEYFRGTKKKEESKQKQ